MSIKNHINTIYTSFQKNGVVNTTQIAATHLVHQSILFPLYRVLKTQYINRRYAVHAAINPYRKLWVDPAEINRISSREYKFNHIGYVFDGDWDKNEKVFTEYDMHQSFKSYFQDGLHWEDTQFYQRVIDQISKGHTKWGCKTPEEFYDRLKKIEALYESIKQHGYKESGTISDDPMDDARRENYTNPNLDEIKIDIGRNGELLFQDGRHRLSLCKILEVDEIPVIVIGRHKEWQEKREKVAKTGSTPDKNIRQHPDLTLLSN